MAHHERSIGPLYVAKVRINRFFCPPHRVEIIQMVKPWRRGRALLVPLLFRRALALGIWRRTVLEDIDEDFEDDRWFNPKWYSTEAEVIASWSDGSEFETQEAQTAH